MKGHSSTASIDKRIPERLERWMLLVSSATMMPTTMYPVGQYQCLRNHIRSSAFRTRTRDGRINSGLRDRSVCVLLKVLAVWIWVVATEVMLLVVSVLLLKLVVDRWGPGRLRGMASCGEADDG